jgi:Jacalin-like lectin domain
MPVLTSLRPLSAGDSILYPMGPSGGAGGRFFDDIPDQHLDIPTVSIVRVEVHYGKTLDSLSVTYQSAGLTAGPFRHGGPGGPNAGNFVVQPGERLVRVEGWVHIFSGTAELNGVKLTVLRPNGTHRNSGVLGNVDGSYFIYVPPPPSEIATFFGRQGNFLDALGIYVRNLAIPK